MSILIKGLSMPKDGTVVLFVHPHGEVQDGNQSWYDAVEVHTPHGRLIDATQAEEAMLFEMCGTGYQSRAMDVVRSDFLTPTVIEEEKA